LDNNEFVVRLQKREGELMKICAYHSLNENSSYDIIQDTYLKLLLYKDINKYVKDGEPNMYIVFMIVRNSISDLRKKDKKYSDENCDLINDETDLLVEEKMDNTKYESVIELCSKIPYWFDRTIVELYIKEGLSVRGLSRACGIKFHVIQPIIKKFKDNCKEQYKK